MISKKRTKNLALKLLSIKKIYHLYTLHLYPAQTRKRTKKELPNSYIKLLNYRHPIVRFLQKTRAWSRSKSLWPMTTLVQITHHTSPNYANRPQLNIHCIQIFFTVHDFCACPEKTELPWNFSLYWIHFLHSGVLSNLRLLWKTELPWNFSLYWICIFYHSGVLSKLRLFWKFSSPRGRPPSRLARLCT